MEEETQLIKTVSSAWFCYLSATEEQSATWLNLANILTIYELATRNQLILKLVDQSTMVVAGQQADELREELRRLSRHH